MTGHSSAVYSVAFSPDGQKLASGSDDNTIKIWNITTGKAITTLTGHSSSVYSVAFSPDGQKLASGSSDNTIILWDLNFDDLLRSACNLLNYYLIGHPEVLADLSTCQTPSRKEKAASVLVIQGEKLAQNNEINAAIDKFDKAQQWDKSLKFDPQKKAQEFANKGK
ncbi:WD-40 repeat-containing protein [Nostoc carneum NIES-2107]|nr:WD-40 repeat-containing protein [Nostoc carneum NIES-2107]